MKPEASQSNAAEKWIASQRYQALPESEQVSFAMEYQLLTDKTDYLVELQRTESEKSDAIPGLVKMPQMQVKETASDYRDIPAFLRRQADTSDSIMFSHKGMMDVVKEVFTENPETKQIKQLNIYLEKVSKGEVEFELTQLHHYQIPQEVMDTLRLIILLIDQEQAFKLLQQLCSNADNWDDIDEKLEKHALKLKI